MKHLITTLFTITFFHLVAQEDTIPKLSFSAYGEFYYSYDFSKPANHEKAPFLYNHKRHNELNVNLIALKANYTSKYTRANLSLMAGNYAQYNLSSEPTWAQFINEANIGTKLSGKHNLWLDAGIMPSHIGFESAFSADCWTLTRSILAENSPYFQSGLKLSYTNAKENVNLVFLVLNGWQRIQKPDYINKPSFGFQCNVKITDGVTFNYSNFIGTDKPDSLHALRTFHNFYLQYDPGKKLGLTAGFDIGRDKYNASDYAYWFSPVLILKYKLHERLQMALRGEYYDDRKNVLIPVIGPNGFQVSGVSTNLDYVINQQSAFRVEWKMYHANEKLFQNGQNTNHTLTTNLTIRL